MANINRRDILKIFGTSAAIPAVKEIEALNVEPGDVVVLTFERPLSFEAHLRIKRLWEECLGGRFKHIPLLILEECRMEVLKKR